MVEMRRALQRDFEAVMRIYTRGRKLPGPILS